MRTSLLAFATTSVFLLSSVAKADTFSFSASVLGSLTSGVLTATSNNDGSYAVTGMTGTAITGLIPAGDAFFGNDNLLFPSNTRSLDVNGLGFTERLAGGIYSVDLFSTVSGFEVLALDGGGNISFSDATFTLGSAATPTPEPSSLLLFGTGLLGAGATALRRRVAR